MHMTEFSILVVDDDTDFLTGIIRHLEKQFTEVEILGRNSASES